MIPDRILLQQIETHAYPLVFATISGAHLYGFPSPDSDFDLRGVHLLPLRQVVGLDAGEETVERSSVVEGIEIDLVTHDAAKFFQLVLKKNGYVLEQIFSPLVVHSTPEHAELKAAAANCITRHHSHHYLGFAKTQWKLFRKEEPPRVKPLLYVYRVLLTGIHLMRTGRIEADLKRLNTTFRLSFLDDLIAAKVDSEERAVLRAADLSFHEGQYNRLTRLLEEAATDSQLPEYPRGKPALNDLLIRLRLSTLDQSARDSRLR